MENTPPIERRSDRQQVFVHARCRISSWHVGDAALSDISAQGCCITTKTALNKGQTVEIRHGSNKGLPGMIRWVDGTRAGVEFDKPLDGQELEKLLNEHGLAGANVSRLPLRARNSG